MLLRKERSCSHSGGWGRGGCRPGSTLAAAHTAQLALVACHASVVCGWHPCRLPLAVSSSSSSRSSSGGGGGGGGGSSSSRPPQHSSYSPWLPGRLAADGVSKRGPPFLRLLLQRRRRQTAAFGRNGPFQWQAWLATPQLAYTSGQFRSSGKADAFSACSLAKEMQASCPHLRVEGQLEHVPAWGVALPHHRKAKHLHLIVLSCRAGLSQEESID